MDGKTAGSESRKWAIVTAHPRLPPKGDQIARARAWGVFEDTMGRQDLGAMIIDDVSKVGRTTNWAPKLVERAAFLSAMSAIRPMGDVVWFATPLCVGFSVKHARETIEAIWACGMLVFVHTVKGNGPALYASGDDLTELLDMVAQEANVSAVRVSRSKS